MNEPSESTEEFEEKLICVLTPYPAPPGLKRAILQRRSRERAERRRRMVWFERLAASLVLACAAGGGLYWRHTVEVRKGEAAKQQVFTALRIANRALEQMNVQLEQQNQKAE
jgi:type VI protein secretion system component VasK